MSRLARDAQIDAHAVELFEAETGQASLACSRMTTSSRVLPCRDRRARLHAGLLGRKDALVQSASLPDKPGLIAFRIRLRELHYFTHVISRL